MLLGSDYSRIENTTPEMQQMALTFGFSVFGRAADLSDILDYCHATGLENRGTHRTVMVPVTQASQFLKILDCVLDVEDIHGLTAQGRMPLQSYLKAYGIPMPIAV